MNHTYVGLYESDQTTFIVGEYTDSNGNYDIQNIAPQTVYIKSWGTGSYLGEWHSSGAVTISTDTTTSNLNFALTENIGGVSGTVTAG